MIDFLHKIEAYFWGMMIILIKVLLCLTCFVVVIGGIGLILHLIYQSVLLVVRGH